MNLVNIIKVVIFNTFFNTQIHKFSQPFSNDIVFFLTIHPSAIFISPNIDYISSF